MKNEIEVQLLNKLAEAYTKYDATIIENYLSDDVHYASMWVFGELESKEEYMDYLRGKLQTMKNNYVVHEFEIVQGQRGLGLLVTNAKSPEGGGLGFVIQLNEDNKILKDLEIVKDDCKNRNDKNSEGENNIN